MPDRCIVQKDTYPFFLVSVEHEDVQLGHPLVELVDPVVEGRLGHNDEVGSVNSAIQLEVTEERNGLESFAETHFIGKNAVDTVVVERNEPGETLKLVVTHLAALDVWKGFDGDD